MSNYYISKCCKKVAKYITSGEEKAFGQCTKCFVEGELEAVIDINSKKDVLLTDMVANYKLSK